MIDNRETLALIDSGAEFNVVPECLVDPTVIENNA